MSERFCLGRQSVTTLLSATMTFALLTPVRSVQNTTDEEAATLAKKAGTVLSLKCVSCHNADKKAGGIDLTTRDVAMMTHGFVPYDTSQSRMIRMVSIGKMPPEGKLPAAEVTLLKQWIMSGATYSQEHLKPIKASDRPLWSFQPLKSSPVPHSRFDSLSSNPVDRFLFVSLEKSGLHPSPLADRRALIRRVTVDLTGLPPTPTEVEAFLADRSPDAYEKVVDRLLASPAYGERWGRHWLDVVRFGESDGYERNHLRPNAWPYRDYVIHSFNQDKPYYQFITEQLAGDIVGKGDPYTEIGTGFLVAGTHDTVGISTEEGTRQQRANDLDDMVSTTGAAFLGLTVNCAKCHDHKFDPIPTRDFYRLEAVFAGVRHGERQLSPFQLTPAQQAQVAKLHAQMQTCSEQINALDAEVQMRLMRDTTRHRVPVNVRNNIEEFAPVDARFVRFTVLATNDGAEPCLDELQVFAPGSEVNVAAATLGSKANASSLLPGFAEHQIAHLNDGLFGNGHSWISNERGKGWAQIELPNTTRIAKVVWGRDAEERYKDRLPTSYRVEVSLDGNNWKQAASDTDRLPFDSKITTDVLVKAMTQAQRTRRQQLETELATLKRHESVFTSLPVAYVGSFTAPDPIYILPGGDVMRRGELVTPGALSEISELPSDFTNRNASRTNESQQGVFQANAATRNFGPELVEYSAALKSQPIDNKALPDPRLALARWICDSRNPLTARVMVNRVWEHHFGVGIVDTPSDFGNIGSRPTHPELLDWLALNFMEHDWKLKRLHRLVVTSYAYRQTSSNNPAGLAKDSDNRLLWRMPLRRMEAEAVRDAVLATSGKLDYNTNQALSGPSYLLFKYNVANVAIYDTLEEQGPETWRRSVYQMAARGIHDDLLGNFDCPDSSERTPKRSTTTTALQALSMLNSRFISEQSEYFAERVRHSAGLDVEAQVRTAFQLALGRSPTATEKQMAVKLVNQDGLAALCRGLLNTNEFLYY